MKNKKQRVILAICISLTTAASNFAFAAWENKSKAQMQKHANDQSVSIKFSPGTSMLTVADQTKIRDLVTNVGANKIDKIEVAVWSDQALPKSNEDVTAADRDLADMRATVIRDYLKDNLSIAVIKIKTFNMSETSNWLSKAFGTDQSELKSVFSKEAAAPMERKDFEVIKNEGAPSKAVIVVVPRKQR